MVFSFFVTFVAVVGHFTIGTEGVPGVIKRAICAEASYTLRCTETPSQVIAIIEASYGFRDNEACRNCMTRAQPNVVKAQCQRGCQGATPEEAFAKLDSLCTGRQSCIIEPSSARLFQQNYNCKMAAFIDSLLEFSYRCINIKSESLWRAIQSGNISTNTAGEPKVPYYPSHSLSRDMQRVSSAGTFFTKQDALLGLVALLVLIVIVTLIVVIIKRKRHNEKKKALEMVAENLKKGQEESYPLQRSLPENGKHHIV
ncbi:uncharacterized protein LOC106181536 [Lingula anatina]|uniref:Uncharacterized protein LOC106181536 n=1 Tax=Lingula anatina TaxID=7574 RepID=A0A1S3KFZ1_LINAN|nr:uncharacterized protein LOC106181536 [Lingula anatina]|eukprot:XP_013421407.1 uncharacterized protein LOC106181536 [Lingula anatina]